VLNGIVYRMRSGCQWNQLPKDFGDDSTVHRWFQRWCADGIFRKLWALLLSECDGFGGVNWQWQAADGAMGKARFGGRKSAPIRPIGESLEPRKACSSRAAEVP
jgi:putative transposase